MMNSQNISRTYSEQLTAALEEAAKRNYKIPLGINVTSIDQYSKFRRAYRDNPAAFVMDCIQWKEGEKPTDYQLEIISDLVSYRRESARGPHGLGKTAIVGWAVNWFALTNDIDTDWKIPVTASSWRQLSKYAWPEVRKWANRLNWGLIGRDAYNMRIEMTYSTLHLKTGEAFAMASDNPVMIEGAHASRMLYIFDESKEIMADVWDSAEGAFSAGDCVVGETMVSAIGVERVARRWYEGEMVQIKTLAGHHLTITPNHSILTPDGWVKAGELNIFDKVISSSNADALMSGIEPDAVQIPTPIKDVFESSSIVNKAFTQIMIMLGSKDLNGTIANCKVNIEAAYGFLRNRVIAIRNKVLKNPCFMDTGNKTIALPCFSPLAKLLLRLDLTNIAVTAFRGAGKGFVSIYSHINRLALRRVSMRSKLLETASNSSATDIVFLCKVIWGRAISVLFEKRGKVWRTPFGSATNISPNINAVQAEIASNRTGGDVELFSKIDSASPGDVFIDEIVDLRRVQFKGHVYDLQTKTHWLVANDDKTKPITKQGGIIIHNCYWLAVSTPGEPQGRFYEIQSHASGFEDWHVRHVTLNDAIAAGRINESWVEARIRQWSEESAVYKNRVLGEFASSDEDGLIPLSWVERANERWMKWKETENTLPFVCVGADIARGGADKTCLALRFGNVISEIRKYSHADTMETTGRIKGILDVYGGKAVVDVVGIGAGVVDRLREMKYEVRPHNAGEHSDARDKSGELGFVNVRSAGWWHLRELLDPDNPDAIALPPNDLLTGDLVSPHWKVVGGKIQLEKKDDIKVRINRSTDDGDAVVMAFFEDAQPTLTEWLRVLKEKNSAEKV